MTAILSARQKPDTPVYPAFFIREVSMEGQGGVHSPDHSRCGRTALERRQGGMTGIPLTLDRNLPYFHTLIFPEISKY